MYRSLTAALALSIATLALPALAHGDRAGAFPMKAADFHQQVEARLAKRKAHVEKRIVDQKLDAAKAKDVRDRFEARAQKVRAAAGEAEKDGVVTAEEARTVRAAGGHGRHRGHHGK